PPLPGIAGGAVSPTVGPYHEPWWGPCAGHSPVTPPQTTPRRGKVRYDLNELPLAVRDEYTREVLWHEDTPPMPESAPRAA
ncbi:hypothetical protein KBZ21_40240, partial [Streptomyces sp. A73]|nr:hypothetical protein [Streptomyces sp. A73]